MKLFQIIASAQGGRVFGNMSHAFNLSDELIAQAVRYFIPPITKAIERRAQTPKGLLTVLEFLGARRYDRFLNDPRIFGHTQVRQEGERILQFLFVREERIKKLIENRAKVLPIEASALEQLFPYVAVMAFGSIEIRTRRPLGAILHRLTKGAMDSRSIANPYLGLAQHLKKQERENKEQRRRRLFAFLGGGNITPVARQPASASESPALLPS
jgi:hypothetical protein